LGQHGRSDRYGHDLGPPIGARTTHDVQQHKPNSIAARRNPHFGRTKPIGAWLPPKAVLAKQSQIE
jgi:hypothetical protein